MHQKISSLTNPKIKNIVRLRDRKARKERGLTIIEGLRENLLALQAGIDIQEVYYSENFENKALEKEIHGGKWNHMSLIETTAPVFQKISYGKRKTGILSVAKIKSPDLADFKVINNGIYVVIEHVEKPGNLGAILRSCDGVGVSGVLVCQEATDLYNPNVIRASLGAVFTLKTATTTNEDAFNFLRKNDMHIVAASPDAQDMYSQIKIKKTIALVLGSETDGLSSFWLKNCDQLIRIPMQGQVDSLNVSASSAIILYEINRQKGQ